MAIWTDQKQTPQILRAADAWRQKCLLRDGSVFTDRSLWTKQNISELRKLFVDNPILGGDQSFYKKLYEQIGNAKPEISQLASEAIWLLLLFVYEGSVGINKKRERIAEVWAFSGETLPASEQLADDCLKGLANPGISFIARIWLEFGFLLIVMQAWKSLPSSERPRLLLDNPWDLCQWVTKLKGGDVRGFRHMFLYFCYPVHFERICSRAHKKKIYSAFAHRLAGQQDAYNSDPSPCSLDKALFNIRQVLQTDYQTNELDFYCPPLLSQWQKAEESTVGKDSKESDAEPSSPYTIEDAVENLFFDLESAERIMAAWQIKKNLILQGPPGVGKTFAARSLAYALMGVEASERLGVVQFHQSYSYEDFIQGYRPAPGGFALRNGRFINFCQQAAKRPENEKFVFIIDEINRGNLSKIFGELMLLIEADKRGEEWEIPLAYSETSEKFFVPRNVYLLGLMNTADRSLAVVDYALRRRFGFFNLSPQFQSEKFKAHLRANDISDKLIAIITQRMGELNQEIEADKANLGRGYCIGHSFFCAKRNELLTENDWYRLIIETEVVPLLQEYWFDNPTRISTWRENLLAGI